jgi:hypothetical protein
MKRTFKWLFGAISMMTMFGCSNTQTSQRSQLVGAIFEPLKQQRFFSQLAFGAALAPIF